MSRIRLTRRARHLGIVMAGGAIVVAAVLGGVNSSSGAAPTVTLAQLQHDAFTGNATIEMVINTKPGAPPIKGENSDSSIAVRTLRWDVKRPITVGGPGAGSGKVSFDPITITKDVDTATTGLLNLNVGSPPVDPAGNLPSAVIYIKPAVGEFPPDRNTWPLQLTLTPVSVVSVEENAGTSDSSAPETVTMVTSKLEFKYRDPGGKLQIFSWNVLTNRP